MAEKKSGLRAKIAEASAAARKSETVQLPVAGVPVLVIGMMLGDRLRVAGDGKDIGKRLPLMIALTAHDPQTKELLWNANSAEDMREIAALTGEDGDALVDAALRTSGMEKDAGKGSAGSAEPS
jgi:hypothetical protein